MAKVKIPKGTVLTQDMLAVKVAEPMGIDAEDIFKMVGKKVKKDVEEDESILPEVVEGYCKKRKCWWWPGVHRLVEKEFNLRDLLSIILVQMVILFGGAFPT